MCWSDLRRASLQAEQTRLLSTCGGDELTSDERLDMWRIDTNIFQQLSSDQFSVFRQNALRYGCQIVDPSACYIV